MVTETDGSPYWRGRANIPPCDQGEVTSMILGTELRSRGVRWYTQRPFIRRRCTPIH